MRWFRIGWSAVLLGAAVACSAPPVSTPRESGPAVDPAEAATITVTVRFEGTVPTAAMMRLDGDPKCVTEIGAGTRADESLVVQDGALQHAFVYIKDGIRGRAFPVPTEPVVLDQDKCRYTPRVLGVRVGQPLQIRNSDPLLHNVRSQAEINQPFNMSTPVEGMKFDHVFATREIMVPFKCDVHAWMTAFVGVVEHPYFATTAADGRVVLNNVPPGTYTIEAWHETLGTKSEQVAVAAKDSKDVSFTFAR